MSGKSNPAVIVIFEAEWEQSFPGSKEQFSEHRFMDWPADPWTLGGYSIAAPGQLTAFGALLHESIGRVRFAGEHTCPAFAGYMEGALQSGVRAAQSIIAS